MTLARVHINFVAKSERPSLTSSEDIAIIQKMWCRTPIRGHARGQKWYHWIHRVGFPISV